MGQGEAGEWMYVTTGVTDGQDGVTVGGLIEVVEASRVRVEERREQRRDV